MVTEYRIFPGLIRRLCGFGIGHYFCVYVDFLDIIFRLLCLYQCKFSGHLLLQFLNPLHCFFQFRLLWKWLAYLGPVNFVFLLCAFDSVFPCFDSFPE